MCLGAWADGEKTEREEMCTTCKCGRFWVETCVCDWQLSTREPPLPEAKSRLHAITWTQYRYCITSLGPHVPADDIYIKPILHVPPGFTSPIASCGSSPSVHPPLYLWGPSSSASKPLARRTQVCTVRPPRECVWPLTHTVTVNGFSLCSCDFQVLTGVQQRALCRIGALVRSFLTRRLLKTDKVKQLRQTVVVRSHLDTIRGAAFDRMTSCTKS